MKFCAVILAAGDGSRLKANTPKPLVKINNKSIIEYIVDTFLKFENIQIIVVVKKNSPIIDLLGDKCKFVFQRNPKGTGHAVKCALDYIKQYDHTFISVGDSPLISYKTLKKMTDNHLLNNIDCSFLTANFPQSYPYASIIRDENMKVAKCIEQQDANDDEKNRHVEKLINENFDLSPRGIREMLSLNKPIYEKTAAYGHFGREPESDGSFSWEKTDKKGVFSK